MYIAKASLSNLRTEGLLSGEDHLNNYRYAMAAKSFHFHTLNESLGGSLFLLCYYNQDKQRAIQNMTDELRSHSLRADLGEWTRLNRKEFKEMFGWCHS